MERHRSGSRPTKRRRDGSSSSRTSSNESCDTRKKKKKRKSSDGRGQPASPKSRRVSSRTDLKSHATRHKKHKPGTSDKHKHKKHESSRHKRKIVHSSSSSSYSDSDSSDVESCSEGSSSDSTEVERKRHKLKHRHKPRHKKAKNKTPKTSISKSKHKKCITAPPSGKSSISKATDSTQETPAVKKPGGEKGTTVTKQRGPMTKEEWERQQGIVRRVYDPDTGRHRLVKGDGEVVEEIVSRDRQKDINKQATAGDSMSFQQGLRKLL